MLTGFSMQIISHLAFTNVIKNLIAFPPCTHLAVSGARWFEQKRKDGDRDWETFANLPIIRAYQHKSLSV